VHNARIRGMKRSLTCKSPLCDARFKPGAKKNPKPKRFCSAECRQDFSILKRAGKLLAKFPDEEALAILRGKRLKRRGHGALGRR